MTTNDLGLHTAIGGFRVVDDCLLIGGVSLPQLAERVGTTPFYAYDRALLSARVASLRASLPDTIHVHYAVKANPMPAVVQHLAPLLDGLDVASAGELRVALDSGVAPGLVSFAGPGKTREELAQAHAAGIVLNVESTGELAALAELGERSGRKPTVALRVNPDFELKTSGMKMSGGPKQFGIDAEVVPQVLSSMRAMAVEFVGFHIFSGSQNLRAEAICEAQQKSLALAVQLAAHAPAPVRSLNIGGGFGIPYFPGDAPLELAPIADNLAALSAQAGESLPGAQLVIELGR